jgi:hypothetical protein
MENSFDINFSGNPSTHQCEQRIEGDWVIFTCPICKDYERRINLKSKEMQVYGSEGNPHLHRGTFIKPGFENLQCNLN